jgi:hypothetical protein
MLNVKWRLISFASALSLLLCVAISALWIRSYWNRDSCSFYYFGERWELVSQRGWLRADNQPQREDENRLYDQGIRSWVQKTLQLSKTHHEAVRALNHLNASDPRYPEASKRAQDTMAELIESLDAEPQPIGVTKYEAHSTFDAIPVAIMAILPFLWLVRRMARRSQHREGRLASREFIQSSPTYTR